MSLVSCLLSPVYGAEVTRIKIKKVGECVKVIVSTDASQYKDTVLHNPQRIVIDFKKSFSRLPKEITSSYLPLLKIRTSQYTINPPTTRVVLDLKNKITHSISLIKGGLEINLGKKIQPSQKELPIKPKVESKKEPKVKPTKKPKVKLTEEIKKTSELPSGPEAFFYNPRGKRDPFRPYLGADVKDTLLDIGTAAIVGIMWSPKEKYALAQDSRNRAYILQEGDHVSGGKVLHIKKKEVIFLMRVFGGRKKVILKVTPKKEEK